MGRKELVLINLAPATSPCCLLTGLLALVLPSRCAPSLQVELVLHFVLVRRGGVLLDLPAGDGSRANEKRESQAIPQAKTGPFPLANAPGISCGALCALSPHRFNKKTQRCAPIMKDLLTNPRWAFIRATKLGAFFCSAIARSRCPQSPSWSQWARQSQRMAEQIAGISTSRPTPRRPSSTGMGRPLRSQRGSAPRL